VAARFPMVARIDERSADWEVAKSRLVAQPSPDNVLMRRVWARKRGWGAGIFTLPCQGEGRGPQGRGVGSAEPSTVTRPAPIALVGPCPKQRRSAAPMRALGYADRRVSSDRLRKLDPF
jgi:hypothetical protein